MTESVSHPDKLRYWDIKLMRYVANDATWQVTFFEEYNMLYLTHQVTFSKINSLLLL